MKHSSILKFYLAIASLIGLIGIVIGFGSAGYTGIKKIVISDSEYILGSNSYEIKACEDPTFDNQKNISTPKTPDQITTCKKDATERLTIQRHYNDKDTIISGLVWGTILLLVFLAHFPFFIKTKKEES